LGTGDGNGVRTGVGKGAAKTLAKVSAEALAKVQANSWVSFSCGRGRSQALGRAFKQHAAAARPWPSNLPLEEDGVSHSGHLFRRKLRHKHNHQLLRFNEQLLKFQILSSVISTGG
jgi:hypothetical protein